MSDWIWLVYAVGAAIMAVLAVREAWLDRDYGWCGYRLVASIALLSIFWPATLFVMAVRAVFDPHGGQ